MESPPTSDVGGTSFDSSRPFAGLVLCCTSIEADQRTEIAQRTSDMGGVHKYDLTPDVTHLVVGDYNTAKYRHVARERQDVKPMAAGWIDAVRTLWLADQEIDFVALENEWKLQTFQSSGGIPNSHIAEERERKRLVCCLTGFEDNDIRTMIEEKVRSNGGEYIGDLSKRVTHLIVCKPEGKKYVAARKWNICTVSIEWLHDSVERGMILSEDSYDPTLPPEERGRGAWIRKETSHVSLGKRSRDGAVAVAEDGRRKLRKTASMKLISQKDNLWGDILVNHSSTDLSKSTNAERAPTVPSISVADSIAPAADSPMPLQPEANDGQAADGRFFSSCRFFVHGFPSKREQLVSNALSSAGGQISSTLDDVASSQHSEPSDRRYLVVPQLSQPDSHPQLPEGVHIVTEFYIERCIHNKRWLSSHDHVLGQPFPRFPIDGFQNLTICTSGFRDEQLNQVEKTVTQLGGKYSERLNPQISLLVCPSLAVVRKQKLDIARLQNVPVVEADWLWQSITTGCLIPWERYMFKELRQNVSSRVDDLKRKEKEKFQRTRSEPGPKKSRIAPPSRSGVDMTAFDDTPVATDPKDAAIHRQGTDVSHYETAPTHQTDAMDTAIASAPLAVRTSNELNKSPSPPKPAQARKLKRFPTEGTIADSEGGDESDTTSTRPSKETMAEDEEAERKRKAAEAKETELKEMSKRIDSLVAHGGPTVENAGDPLKPQPRQPRRKREIFGRAASNVSAASSASAESSTNNAGGGSKSSFASRQQVSLPSASGSLREGKGGDVLDIDRIMEADGQDSQMANNADADADNAPPATQLGYDNPEARRHRADVMDRMLGNKKKGASAGGRRQSQEKVTLSDLKAAEMGTGSGGGGTRRTTRRR